MRAPRAGTYATNHGDGHVAVGRAAEGHDEVLVPPALELAFEERFGVIDDLIDALLVSLWWIDVRWHEQNQVHLAWGRVIGQSTNAHEEGPAEDERYGDFGVAAGIQ